MNQDNFLWGLQITDGLTMELVSQMTVIAFGVGVICFICNIAYNYLAHGASQLLNPNEDKFPDMMEIARCLVLFFCLTLYKPIAQTIVGTMEVINEATSLTSDRARRFRIRKDVCDNRSIGSGKEHFAVSAGRSGCPL